MSKQKLKYIIIALSAVFVILLIFFLYVISKPAPVPLGPENMIDISDIETTESFLSDEPAVIIEPENEEYIEVTQFNSFEEYQTWVESEKKHLNKSVEKIAEEKKDETEITTETKKKKKSKKDKDKKKEKSVKKEKEKKKKQSKSTS